MLTSFFTIGMKQQCFKISRRNNSLLFLLKMKANIIVRQTTGSVGLFRDAVVYDLIKTALETAEHKTVPSDEQDYPVDLRNGMAIFRNWTWQG